MEPGESQQAEAKGMVADPFTTTYRTEYPGMVRLAFVLTGNAQAAEDVVQDAFALLHAKWDGVDNPGGYLRVTIVNLCRNRARRRQNERRVGQQVLGRQLSSLGASELADVLLGLPYRQRAVLVLRYWGDWSEAEIAARVALSPGHGKDTRIPWSRSPEEGGRRMTPNELEDRLRATLREMAGAAPLANPNHPKPNESATPKHGGFRVDYKVLTVIVGILLVIATIITVDLTSGTHSSHPATSSTTTSSTPAGAIVVPNVIGLTTARAAGVLQSAGLTNSIDDVNCHGSVSRGTVAGQSPAADFRAAPESRINLRIVCSASPNTTASAQGIGSA